MSFRRNGRRPNRCLLLPVTPGPKGQGSRRSAVLNPKRIFRPDRCLANLLFPERYYWRPIVRADCINGPRPCPYVGCQYHLFLDVTKTGIRINFPEYEVWDLPISCALDVAESGVSTLEEVGLVFNITRERARQLQDRALKKLAAADECRELLEVSHDLDQGRPHGHPLVYPKPKS